MASNAGKVNGMILSNEPLPFTVDELTKHWFSKILNKPVQDVEVLETIHGTASKISIKLTFENGTGDSTINVCVKGGFNPDIRKSLTFLYAIYRLEAELYYYLAPKLKIPLPPVFYAGTDTVNGQGIVVMADLKAEGYTFGNPLETWPVERGRMSVEQLATLHASTWGDTGEGIPSVSETVSIRDAIVGLLAPEEWDKRFAPDTRPPVPKFMEDRERMTATFKALWESDSKMKCLVHGDTHIGNTFISPVGEPGFLDWQVIHAASALHDVAYFIGGSLSIQDRRAHETDLLQSYLSALKHAGGSELEIEDSREIVDAMVERHCAAIVDHKSIELLETQERWTTKVIDKLDLHSNFGIRVSDCLNKNIFLPDNWTPWVRRNASVVTSKNEVIYGSREECSDTEFRARTFKLKGVALNEQRWNANHVLITKSNFCPENIYVAVNSTSAHVVQHNQPLIAQYLADGNGVDGLMTLVHEAVHGPPSIVQA
ncbi:aminoglycoside phosphotransferase [Fusarium acutatum]|uniref:Aminoglycoside phosphotransferase n=1 Tax=Fusarium acutatum TaxID=78861 RepID=A0A8H4NCX1_9HYPO|nr:aminoglycoside phosphotransferase [Fusarium acutatum]